MKKLSVIILLLLLLIIQNIKYLNYLGCNVYNTLQIESPCDCQKILTRENTENLLIANHSTKHKHVNLDEFIMPLNDTTIIKNKEIESVKNDFQEPNITYNIIYDILKPPIFL